MQITILRLPAVKTRTGLSRSTIYLRMAQGTFPKQISLGSRAVGWVSKEINQWNAERIKESRPCGDSALTSSCSAMGPQPQKSSNGSLQES